MKEEALKIIASADEIALRAVDLYINSKLISIAGNWHWELNCDTIFCSDVMAALTQHYPGTKAIIHPDDIDYVKQRIASLENEPGNIEFRIITTYGDVKKISGKDCFFNEVDELRVSNPEKDIIEKVKKEKEYENSAEELHLLKNISDRAEIITKTGTWYINAVTLETFYSDNVFRIHGILPQSLNAHPHTFRIFLHPEESHTVSEAFDKAFRERVPLHIEYRIIIADEKEKFLTLITHWSHNLKGEDVLNGIITDRSASIFELTKAEAAEHRLEFHNMILQMNQKQGNTAFWYMNLLTRQTFYSDNYYRIHGLKPQPAPARPANFINYVHPDDREKVADSITKIRSEHATPDIEYRVIRGDKKLRYLRQKGQLVTYAHNELIMIVTVHDITAQIYHERKLQELEEEILVKNFVQGQSEQMAQISSWMWEPETGNTVWSSNLYDLLGYKKTVKEITHHSLLKAVLPEDRKLFSDEIQAVTEGTGEREFNFRILKTGEVRNMKACFKLLNYEERRYFVGTMQDITESMHMQEQLYENLQLNQLLSENILDKVFVTDVHNNIILWNKKCEEDFKLKKEQVIGKNYFDIFPDQKIEKIINRFNDVLNGEAVHQLGERFPAKKYYDLHMTPLKEKGNNILGILHVMHDVTKEYTLNNSLNERLGFIEKLLEETVDRIIVLDKNLTYTYWNKKAEQHYHINTEYVVGKSLLEVFPSFVKDPLYPEIKKVLKGETIHFSSPAETEHQQKFSETYLVPLLNAKQEVTGILWIAHDLTEITKAEQEVRDSKELLQSVFDASPNSISVFDIIYDENNDPEDFKILMLNKYGRKSIDNRNIIGQRYSEVFPHVIESGVLEKFKHVAKTGEPTNFEQWYKGEIFNHWFCIHANKVGNLLVVTAEDITQRKTAEEQILRLKDEVNKKATDKYNDLFNSIDQGFCTIKVKYDDDDKPVDYQFVEVSPSFESQTGIKDGAGKWMRDIAPDQEEFWFETYGRIAKNRKDERFEYFSTPLNRWWSVYAFPINEAELRQVGVLFSDITEQINTRKKIEESEKQFRNVLLQSPNIFMILEGFPEMRITFANEPLFQSWGRTADIVGKPLLEVLPELKEQSFPKLLQRVFETGETYYQKEEKAVIMKNGVPVDTYFMYVYQAIFDDKEKVTGVTIMATDITEQVLSRKKVEESEKRFSKLLVDSPFAVAILKGKDMVVTLANDAIKNVWGKGNAIEGKTLLSIMPEIEEQGFATLLDNVYTTGKPFYGHEVPVKLQRNGIWEDVYFNFIYQPYKEANETISGVTIIANEVTNQAMANKKIAASEQNVRRLFMEAPAIICVLRGPKQVYELANDMYMQLIGKRDIVGEPIRKLFPELEGQGYFELLDNVYATGKPFIGKEMLVKFDKGAEKLEEVYFNLVYQPLHNIEGEIDGIMVHGVDVTEQVLSRKKLEESEKHQAFLLKLSDALRPLNNPVDIEEAATKIALDFMGSDRCHYSAIEGGNVIIQQDAYVEGLSSVAGVHSISNFALYKAVLDAGCPFVVDDVSTSMILDEDLKKVCVQFQYGSFINVPILKTGKAVGLFSVVQNKPRKWGDLEVQISVEIAERIWAAVERAKAEKSLKELAELEHKADALLLQKKDEFISIASHELKTPVTNINASLQILQEMVAESPLNKSIEPFLERSLRQSGKLSELVNDLLDATTIAEGKMRFRKTTFNIREALQEIADEICNEVNDCEVQIKGVKSIEVTADKVRVQQVITNFITNAIKYSAKNKTIHISVEKEEQDVKVTVLDKGIGIAPDKLPFVFDKYFRVDETSKKYSGLGLGLYISKEIIKKHGGDVGVNSKEGTGSAFWFTLPFTTSLTL